MRFCIVSRSDIDIFSPKQGGAVKIYYTLISLASLGNEVFFVSEDNEKYYKVVEDEFLEFHYPWIFSNFLNRMEIFKKIMVWLGVPEEEWVLYHPVVNLNMWLRTLYVSLREDVDLIQSEFTGFAFPAIFTKLLTRKPISLVEHNVECFRIMRSYNDLNQRGKKTLKAIERIAGFLSDYVIAVSPEDKKRLENLGIDDIDIIPHGVDVERMKSGDGERIRKKYDIKNDDTVLIFHGVLCYGPNRRAVQRILRDILPQIREFEENFKVLIVGGYPPKAEEPDVIITGFVDRLEDYINAADIAIVPLNEGGGTRLKILEYFASEIPVISTKKGVEGLNVKDKEELVISDISTFPEEINNLLNDEETKEKLMKNGLEYIKDLDWKNIGERYQNLYQGE